MQSESLKSIWIDSLRGTEIYKLDISKISRNEFEAAYFLMSEKRKRKCREYATERDKKLCVAADMLIRQVLSVITGIDKNELIFDIAENGKPFCVNAPCFFNISHSDSIVALAVNREYDVGIDVEKIRAISGNVIKRVCSSEEIGFISAADTPSCSLAATDGAAERFFRVWTYKEAYLKCSGEGICRDLREVSYNPSACFSTIDDGYCYTCVTAS